jgi:uncharacterized SAM-binding protein YcdF (DUF218 family)
MSPQSRSRQFRQVLVGTLLAAAAATAVPGAAQAASSVDPLLSPTTLVNGALSTVGGCQTPIREVILACTRLETLTTQSPVALVLNPIGTNIVVLGAGLFPNGAIRPVLESRLQATLVLAQQFPFTPIIVSGGVPQSGITEARAMREWLIARGIPAVRITEENTSRSTVENAQNTNAILAQRGATGAVVVTSPDHLQRAMVDFRVAVGGRIPIAGVVAP